MVIKEKQLVVAGELGLGEGSCYYTLVQGWLDLSVVRL